MYKLNVTEAKSVNGGFLGMGIVEGFLVVGLIGAAASGAVVATRAKNNGS